MTTTCTCDVVSPEPHQCPVHFRLYRNGRRLVGVSRIVGMWPQEPCSSCGMAMFSNHVPGCRVFAAIENAKERGKDVDDLFSRWINGTLNAIPAGTRDDATARTVALIQWWQYARRSDPLHAQSEVRAQVILADETVGGIADVVGDGFIYDLKNTSEIAPYYPIQLGGYAVLHEAQYGKLPDVIGVIHCTQPKDKPVSVRVVEYDAAECVRDFATCRAMYELVKRRSPKRKTETVMEEM